MKIRENGFVWKVAFYWRDNQPRRKVSVCRVFWHFILGFFILWPLMFLFVGIIFCLINTFGFFVARRVNFPGTPSDGSTIPYKHWPTALGHRVYPIAVIIPAGVIYFFYATWSNWVYISEFVSQSIIERVGIILLVILGVALIILIIIGLRKFWRSETGLLFREYASAFHRHLCPYVDIIPAEPKKKKV